MVFKTSKLLVGKNHVMNILWEKVQDVPGYKELADQGFTGVINFLQNNLQNRDLCLQAVDLKDTGVFVYDENKNLIAANGWRVKQTLGHGKDGVTVLGHRYSDDTQKIKTVKILSKYGESYLDHTRLFNEIFKSTILSPRFYVCTSCICSLFLFFFCCLPFSSLDGGWSMAVSFCSTACLW